MYVYRQYTWPEQFQHLCQRVNGAWMITRQPKTTENEIMMDLLSASVWMKRNISMNDWMSCEVLDMLVRYCTASKWKTLKEINRELMLPLAENFLCMI